MFHFGMIYDSCRESPCCIWPCAHLVYKFICLLGFKCVPPGYVSGFALVKATVDQFWYFSPPNVRGFPVLKRLALTMCVWWCVRLNEPFFQLAAFVAECTWYLLACCVFVVLHMCFQGHYCNELYLIDLQYPCPMGQPLMLLDSNCWICLLDSS